MKYATLEAGYAYFYKGRSMNAANDKWELVVIGKKTAPVVGHRSIDGSAVIVVKTAQGLFAQMVQNVHVARVPTKRRAKR